MKLTFDDKYEKIIFYTLIIFGVFVFGVNFIRSFTSHDFNQYMLLTLEMFLGIGTLFVPFLFTMLTQLVFPKTIRLYYWFFILISVFLGTGLRLIVYISFWDKILHLFSPILLVALGYSLTNFFLKDVSLKKINPWLFLFIGFSFAGICGVFWEFWEFIWDGLIDLNLQRYMTESGIPYVGRAALMDTMEDLLTNTAGSLILTTYSFTQRHKPNYFKSYAFYKRK
ncbi:hypothetical protein QQG09_03625 [Melissococcus plutonius]|uniref:Membrane protein n=1 Tax=Melissococcus plutonius TaxID=33970 RepID=A0A2Z5Y306_9ENTE|nr:hypothetical protein [Melissococcus plutonius]BAL62288.1 hypothetical protein MPD5_1063 [Melissococcus plutonius DAT561]MCV2498060.1 hypothetical protein [Melissococcus plutonius]MCV2500875.1 hypothetical protein [Melissococcus plutonius]MCV2504387.1 hypothetical protein [Melissococcus plutonius]MCV2506675.1 hypothetical protein [Melissococcus plutonius]